jgi:uncharacterized protein (TIGR04222 family)
LTYTRSYWDRLCGEVLRRPLHHDPTQGGVQEQARFVDLYQQTLASYERLLGHQPPAEIWPAADRRFGEDLQHVAVNTARCWIVPKPRLLAWARAAARPRSGTRTGAGPLFALGLVSLPAAGIGPLAAGVMNPLEWKGPDFLAFYIACVVIAAVMALLVRLLFAPEESPVAAEQHSPRDPYAVACLAGGPERAIHAAFAALVKSGGLVLREIESPLLGVLTHRTALIEQGAPPEPAAPPLERALYAAAAVPTSTIDPLVRAGRPVAHEIDAQLVAQGLKAPAWPPPLRCLIAGALMAAPLGLGIAKIVIGISRDKPVGFLIVACVITAILALLFLLARDRLTSRGKSAIKHLEKQFGGTGPKPDVVTLSPADLALGVGLFGAAYLAASPLANVYAMLPREAASSSSGGCSGGGGGCGGGGCGGGGCGGGGCGGCGG